LDEFSVNFIIVPPSAVQDYPSAMTV